MNKRDRKQTARSSQETNSGGFRKILLSFIPFIVFSLGFIPAIITFRLILYGVSFYPLAGLILSPFIIVAELAILLVSEILISGVIIRLFAITYTEGTYRYSVKDTTSFKWMIHCQLYTPMRKLMEIIPVGYLRIVYLRLLGMHIGKSTLLGGIIQDPCMIEVGDNTTIGDYAVLYAHIHDYHKGTLTIKKVKIGKNCIIGAGAIIMPGVIMEDNAILGAGAVVPKDQVLQKNKVYGGNPAKEITSAKKDKKTK